jgi:hypothetical protein
MYSAAVLLACCGVELSIRCYWHICCFFVVLIVSVSVWCWLFWRLFWCQCLIIVWQFVAFHVQRVWIQSIYFVGGYFLWCDLGLLQSCFCFCLWICLFGIGSVVVCSLLHISIFLCVFFFPQGMYVEPINYIIDGWHFVLYRVASLNLSLWVYDICCRTGCCLLYYYV